MSLLVLLLVAIVVVALVLFIVQSLPIDPKAKTAIQLIACLILLIWILAVFFGWVPGGRFDL